ncbi:MAG: hypothetical protein ACQEXE_26055 [Bacillota bacterium]|nr:MULTISPECIES: hypothetical protein [Cytobacillus]MCM3393711.1 hypothetical protein [Cytobacillus oceanisediminis]UQX54091.1 hypothetical protein M5V91_26220 [Cytobacillus pseudoceanisediminis]
MNNNLIDLLNSLKVPVNDKTKVFVIPRNKNAPVELVKKDYQIQLEFKFE